MNKIQVLDQITIDKIAAGEVIERPASVVKELVENAIDAGATSITVEIENGGIALMRIADNGCGISKEDVPNAFLRHSTSKIRSVEDLSHIGSLGFRGEALSSIAAVSQLELLTKTKEDLMGTRYRINGGKEESMEDAAAPDGTTFFVRQLFYNVPARRKFLKTAMTEASHVGDLLTRLALSHPEISFRFINNGQSKLHTSGNGNLRDVIYHVYGREIASNLLPVDYEKNGVHMTGFLGAPIISRGNRNFENYFMNHRYIKSNIISKSIEDAYKDYTMQHKFPFVVLHIEMDGEEVDVNVHPTKMDVRFHNQQEIYQTIYDAVSMGLRGKELIPQVTIDVPKAQSESVKPKPQPHVPQHVPQPKENRMQTNTRSQEQMQEKAQEKTQPPKDEAQKLDYFMEKMRKRVQSYHERNSSAEVMDRQNLFKPDRQADRVREAVAYRVQNEKPETAEPKALKEKAVINDVPTSNPVPEPKIDFPVKNEYAENKEKPIKKEINAKQLDLFEERFLDKEVRAEYKLIGQVFDTYWLVEYHDNLYIIDQHAAHERVLYEKTLKSMKTREFTSQMISPPIILELTMPEQELLKTYMDQFTRIGFEFEEFGQDSYAVRAIPDNLFSIAKKELLMEMLDDLSDELNRSLSPELIDEKIASMSCKAAVKGKMKLSAAEIDTLISELLTLDNPYHCPHGRPTIIAMSRRELEKKFKRIV